MAYHLFYFAIDAGRVPGVPLVDDIGLALRHGYLGVELFFLISGYVIFFSAKDRTPAQFASSRMLRLYPAFLFCMTVTAVVKLFYPIEAGALYTSQVVTNLTMMPRLFGRTEIDGSYWTLAFELCFYALVLIMLLLHQRERLEKMFLIWPVIILLAAPFGSTGMPLLGAYYSYFAAGALFAMYKIKRSNWIVMSLLICFYDSLHAYYGNKSPADVTPMVNIFAISAFYLFMCLVNNSRIAIMRLPCAKFFGSLTYPVYLIHQVIGTVIIAKFANESNKTVVISLVMLGMLAAAAAIHYFIEVRMHAAWRDWANRFVGQPVSKLDAVTQQIRASLFRFGRIP